jgi:hypothetical protein
MNEFHLFIALLFVFTALMSVRQAIHQKSPIPLSYPRRSRHTRKPNENSLTKSQKLICLRDDKDCATTKATR